MNRFVQSEDNVNCNVINLNCTCIVVKNILSALPVNPVTTWWKCSSITHHGLMLAHRLRRWSSIDPFSAGADLDGSESDVYPRTERIKNE